MATYSDPYEQFKADHGGSGAGYTPPGAAPAPAPAAPTNFPPPPPSAAPAPQNGGFASPRPSPTRPTPAPAPGPRQPTQPLNTDLSGQTIEQRFATQRNNTDFRDTNVSPAQWGAWEEEERKRVEAGNSAQQTTPGGCPPDKPFTGRGGQCAFKPDDCPDGTVVQGSDTNGTAKCVPAGAGGGAGGSGGGPGGGAGGAAGSVGTAGAGAGSDLSSMMETALKGGLSGADSRYNPAAMQGLLAKIKQNVESNRQAQVRQAGEAAASRGMSRSGYAGVNEQKINSAAGQSFTSQYGGVLQAKIDADYQDKTAALDRSQKYLDSLRDEMYRRDMSAIQQQQFKANLDLAYANIAAQRDALASNQQYGKDMLGAQYGYAATFGGM